MCTPSSFCNLLFSFFFLIKLIFGNFCKIFHCMIISYLSILLLMDIEVVSDLSYYKQHCNQQSQACLLASRVRVPLGNVQRPPMWSYEFTFLQHMKACFSTVLPIIYISSLLSLCQPASSLLFSFVFLLFLESWIPFHSFTDCFCFF